MTRNYWRVAASMPREDLLQEAYVVFLRCKKKYPRLDTPQHFMALFKTSWNNKFNDLANADTLARSMVELPRFRWNEDGDTMELELPGDMDNEGAFSIFLNEAPAEVKAVLSLFLSAPTELLELALGSWKGSDKRCVAGGSKRINKLLGLPEDLDVMKMTHDYIAGR
jgi:hypothetical protein